MRRREDRVVFTIPFCFSFFSFSLLFIFSFLDFLWLFFPLVLIGLPNEQQGYYVD